MNLNGTLTIRAQDVTTGNLIPEFKFIINENNVGDPQVELPVEERDPSLFPSIKPVASYSPVVASGEASPSSPTKISLPESEYVISVLASNYKMGGEWITIKSDTNTTVEVKLYPNPLPLSKIRVHVFNDNNPVNGEDDFPLESGLEGFMIIVQDSIGEVTVDYFGNLLGTQYRQDKEGNLIFDRLGNPIPIFKTGGKILTSENGDALIDNLPPGKYGIQAIPPDGTDWIQTTTIEGTYVIDVWIEESNSGYLTEEAYLSPLVWIGFVKPMEFESPSPWKTGLIKGRARTITEFAPPVNPLALGKPINRPWIALSDIGGNDQQVYTGRGDENGIFIIKDVPHGTYQMAIWDEPLDHIISFRTIKVGIGEIVDIGDVGIPRWYGYIQGTVFNDINKNGVQDAGEMGIPNVEIVTRFKDGSVQYSTISDMNGHYSLKEVFELGRFAVAEVGFTRFARTGATATRGIGMPSQYHPDVLTLAELTWAGKTNQIDWGNKEYEQEANGGISGIVYYATMRNETNPRLAVPEEYEPGVPHVTLNLYRTIEKDNKLVQGELINTTVTDAWQHPDDCIDENGQIVECIEVPKISNQIRPGVFDGGYAFETYFDPYYGAPDAEEKPLPLDSYIVELVLPSGYKVLDEKGSTNTDEGDEFEPGSNQLRMLPPPYYKPPATPGKIDVTKKVVKVSNRLNPVADFFLYTDVSVPGRMIGFLLDDVNVETDPNLINYGEKRGIPDTPIGIRDFTGRLITTVHSDKNGVFEVLLPSTYTRNIPTPSGVVPGMYQVIGNDPGDPENPNERYNPNYQTLKLVFDLWPGKTTYADVALFPITAFVETPRAQFAKPPICNLPDEKPQIFNVSRIEVKISDEDDANRTIKILGTGFESISGTVTLDKEEIKVVEWGTTQIKAIVPTDFSVVGPTQLLVTNSSGKTTSTGITLHVCKEDTYWPNIVQVKEDGTGDYSTIQDAIDHVPEETVIAVFPGTYYENPILYKNIKLQGAGTGGIMPNGTEIQGSVIDGRFILSQEKQWLTKLNSIEFDGAEFSSLNIREVSIGQVLTVVARVNHFTNTFKPQVDGFKISGARGQIGGGIYANAHCRYLVISNNVIQNNGGGFGGGITIGKAYVGDNYNDHIHIHHNRILNNGGISLAGGIGIFNGADNYNIEFNHICGNYSAEYGGGISHFGLSKGGQIHHNNIGYNSSFDEGAGIFVGGEQPMPPAELTLGSGEVDIYNNLILGNVANDDGGGIRLLQSGEYGIRIVNNMIVNNVSTDLAGGIALDDASNVIIVNNTIAKNVTTATAEDSDGLAHGSGLMSEKHSFAFQSTLSEDASNFSDPILFNNIFWDNRAGIFDQTLNDGRGGIWGIGNYGEVPNVIDLEVFGTPKLEHFNPEYCSLTMEYVGGNNNIVADPMFVKTNVLQIRVASFNMQPDFKSVKIIIEVPENLGDYHITEGSPVRDQGTQHVIQGIENYYAPETDFDGDSRPQDTGYDIGADEYVSSQVTEKGV